MATAPDLRLIVITDAAAATPRGTEDLVAEALQAGAPAVQLRNKDATAAELFQQTIQLLDLTRTFGALLFVNDRIDVALAAGADGVHLGPHDLPVAYARAAARTARRGDFLIGASTDRPDTARRLVREGADYIGCGAVFGTASKPGIEGERIGTDGLARVVRAVNAPVVGIGGITVANIDRVAATGAAGAAAIQAIMAADDVSGTVKALLAAFA
jgi:thiamine-phosphate pyrophosphorylase